MGNFSCQVVNHVIFHSVVGIMRFHMLEGVKAVQRLYKMRTLILVRDLPRMLYIGAQKVNKPN